MAVCGECGARFEPTTKQRENIAKGNTVYCTRPCLYLSRGRHSKARWENGVMPAWGSPAQIAARDRLVEHSRVNKITGPAHSNWKGGKWSKEAQAARRVKWLAQVERRAAAPKEYPCMVCDVWFELNKSQRLKWYKYGSSVGYCCSHCKCRTSITNVPPHYYAPAECSKCEKMFTPGEQQRLHRRDNPDAELCCSKDCLREKQVERLANYREANGIMQGPTHAGWKTGWHSKQAQETRHLIYSIKKFINEGVK